MSEKKAYYYGKNTKDCYYSKLWSAYILDYYENESFPMFGWIKPCIYCMNIGSSYMTRNYMDKIIIIHACKPCIKKHKYNIFKESKIYKRLKNAMYIMSDQKDFIIL